MKSTAWCGDAIQFFRGFCMGAADTVPGVSGGTVALILGHYQRLLMAISRFDTTALKLTLSGRWADLSRHIDLRFLLLLGCGIVAGAGALATTMHWLLEHRMPQTYAVFFGLVLASGWIVAKWVERWGGRPIIGLVVATAFAFWLAGLPIADASDSRVYLFGASAIAICAMILPGISGAFVLLLLGMYHPVIGMIKRFVRLDISGDLVIDLAIFASGCVVGLAAFSRLLKWLIRDHPDVTLASLLGLMLGSLRRIWPLQQATEATAELAFKERQFVLVPVDQWPGELTPLVLSAVAAGFLVIVAERIADKRST